MAVEEAITHGLYGSRGSYNAPSLWPYVKRPSEVRRKKK